MNRNISLSIPQSIPLCGFDCIYLHFLRQIKPTERPNVSITNNNNKTVTLELHLVCLLNQTAPVMVLPLPDVAVGGQRCVCVCVRDVESRRVCESFTCLSRTCTGLSGRPAHSPALLNKRPEHAVGGCVIFFCCCSLLMRHQ